MPPTFYIFHGEDDMAIEDEVNKLRAMMRSTPNGELNMVEFEGAQVNAPEIISAASAYPFLADKRMVIVKGFLAHITRKGAGETGTVGPPAVLANAVEDALRPLGIKIRKVPLSPSYLWSLIEQVKVSVK